MRRMCGIPIRAFLVLFLFVFVQFGFAQLDNGSISGTVVDASGAVIPNATVKVTSEKTNRVWNAKTGAAGEYSVTPLPVGTYQVETSASGFKTGTVVNVVLHAAETARANFKLEIGSTTEVVRVEAEALQVNVATSENGGTIQSRSVSSLPLNGRDFTSLIALVPGSVQSGSFGQNSIGGFESSMAGVNVLLDGSDATRIDVNATSTQLGRQESRISRASIDSIQEFTVLSGVYSAAYGRSTGDVVNVITKSGSNAVHGSVFEYFRNDVLDARNAFATEDTPLRLNQFGGNLSGPLVKNKLFYFVNYEGVRQVIDTPTGDVAVYSDASRALFAPSMYAVRDAIPSSNAPGVVILHDPKTGADVTRTDLAWYRGRLHNTLREDTGSIKLDWNVSDRDAIALRYNISDSFTSTQYGISDGQVSPSTSRNHLFKLTWTRTLTGNIVNEFGVSLNRPQTDSLAGGGDFPIFQCSTFWGCSVQNQMAATPGPALFSNRRPQHSIQVMDTLNWVVGRQTIHLGFDIRHNVTHDALDPQYFLSFANITDFYNNNGVQVDTLGHTMVGVQNTNYGYFFQDDIRLTRRFTVNLGLRYEYNSVLQGSQIGNFDIATLTFLPKGAGLYEPDRNNFAPRVGFSWDLFGTGKTVIRGGGGIFYNPALTGTALSLAGNYQQSISYNVFTPWTPGVQCGDLKFSYPLPATLATCTGLPVSVNSLDRNMRDTYSEHWSFGIQQQIAKDTVVDVSYIGNHGVKLPAGAAYAGLELNYSPLSSAMQLSDKFGNIRRLGNFLSSNYNSLQASFRRHLSKGLMVDANYTWSHELDDAVNIMTSAFQNSHDPKADYASGDIDVRHNFTIGAVYDVPVATFLPKQLASGWTISPMLQARSGMPYNVALSSPMLGIDQLRPNFKSGVAIDPKHLTASMFETPAAGTFGNVPRNFGQGPRFVQMDLALSKNSKLTERLTLELRGELYNLLNHPNFAAPVGYLDSYHFGESTSTVGTHIGTGTSRQAQFAAKLVF